MRLDIPPHIEQAMLYHAHQQGVSVETVAMQALEQHFRQERPFNFDLDEMQQAIDSGFVEMPDWAKKDFASFQRWLQQGFT